MVTKEIQGLQVKQELLVKLGHKVQKLFSLIMLIELGLMLNGIHIQL